MVKNKPIVYIDPRCRVNYASYYILGLVNIYGKKFIKFDPGKFTAFDPLNTKTAQTNGFPFMVSQDNKDKVLLKVYIDFHDTDSIDDTVYLWADIYAKVNLNPAYDTKRYAKILPIGPSFAVDIWSWPATLYYSLKHILTSGNKLLLDKATYFKDHIYLKLRRRPLSDYLQPITPDHNYLFSISTLWYDQVTAATTNFFRGKFYRAAQKHFNKFEGGFFYINDPIATQRYPQYKKYLTEYKDSIYYHRIKMAAYIKKTKKSYLVFNTASVSGCLGWKLAEYLCLGKAIISSPLTRLMPNEGEYIKIAHIINDDTAIDDAILSIKNNVTYHQTLERNAKTYFNRYLSPEAVIKRIVDHGLATVAKRNAAPGGNSSHSIE